MFRLTSVLFLIVSLFSGIGPAEAQPSVPSKAYSVPVILYHRFADTSSNEMTVTVREFEEQMALIKKEGYTVIPLKQLVDAYLGKGAFPPPKSVVLVVDDAHRSFYETGHPIMKRLGYPATLFVYPSCISRASYAMTWEQLREVGKNGVDIQSHTYYHPNFKVEARKQSPADYEKFVNDQLRKSKRVLEEKIGKQISYLAYPFGLFDDVVERKLLENGYEAGFSIVRKSNGPADVKTRLNRYLIVPRTSLKEFKRILETSRAS
ncbi:MAG: polysaccharide deacetylase family protein [Nitrospirota bacterium]|nr:polysaccharide deacetylase family protein [Nitrospirota bacterium]